MAEHQPRRAEDDTDEKTRFGWSPLNNVMCRIPSDEETDAQTHDETKHTIEEGIDDSIGFDFGSERNTSTMDDIDHRFENFQPDQFVKTIKQRQRILHALKVAVAVSLASLFVLISSLNDALQGTGVWAIITVVIVTLQTPGDTTHKMLNRTAGTLVAAVLALLVGVLGRSLSELAFPAGHVFIAVMNFLITAIGIWFSTAVGQWSYAFLLGTLTYVFITISVLQAGSSGAIFRVLMIILGGVIGFLISWLPPHIRALDVARAYLADNVADTAVCAELVVHNFLTGRLLNPIQAIHSGEADDNFHRLYKTIIESRGPLEDAISASMFEGAGKRGKSLQRSGLIVRLALRTLISADVLLRQEYRKLDQTNHDEDKLASALTNVAQSIRVEFAKRILNLKCPLPQGFEVSGHLTLPDALEELNCALHVYIQNRAQSTESNNAMEGFACHVSFARLIYDAGRFVLDVSPSVVPPEGRVASFPSMEI